MNATRVLICVMLFGAIELPARAQFIVTVKGPNGESELSIEPGDPLDLIIHADEQHGWEFAAFAFDVSVSEGGLPVDHYSLSSAFQNGFDFSSVLDSTSLHFEGATAIGAIALPGPLVSLTIDTAGTEIGESFLFEVRPDFFEPPDLFVYRYGPESGPPFTLNIVPEPMAVMLLGVGGLVVLRRRRP